MAYGDGTLYQRGGVWYVQHFAAGRKVRESLHTADEATAIRRAVALRRERERTYKVECFCLTWCHSWLCSYARDGVALCAVRAHKGMKVWWTE